MVWTAVQFKIELHRHKQLIAICTYSTLSLQLTMQGEKGDKGDPGAMGPAGRKGNPGIDV